MESKLIKKIGAYKIVFEDNEYCVYRGSDIVYIVDSLEEAEEITKILDDKMEQKENEKEPY